MYLGVENDKHVYDDSEEDHAHGPPRPLVRGHDSRADVACTLRVRGSGSDQGDAADALMQLAGRGRNL